MTQFFFKCIDDLHKLLTRLIIVVYGKRVCGHPQNKLNFRVLSHIGSLATWLLCACVSQEGVLIPYFVCPRFACWTSKNPKMLFSLHGAVRTFRMTWGNLFGHRNTQSAFSTKMNEMPLANLRLTEGQTRSKPSQNNIFHSFTSN